MAGAGGGKASGRIQLPPATDNKLPVLYGKGFIGGPVTDAVISTDFKTMWFCVALAEHTDTTAGSGYTFGNIFYDGKRVNFGPNGYVNSLTTQSTPSQTDTKVAGQIYIWLFTNGSSSGVNTGGQTAIQIMNDPEIPSGSRWLSTNTMTNCAFAIVKVKFNVDKGTTSLGGIQAEMTNSLNKPGAAILDYLRNTRYGCAVPLARIDTASLTALDNYSDQLITYVPVGGGSATQARYRVNGPLDTSATCLDNLQRLVDSCDSWLQYSELTGLWKVVINKPFDGLEADLYTVTDDNLVGGIDIAPIDLNETYNEVEVAYPNKNIRDQTDYQVLELSDYVPEVMSPNEAVNRLNLALPLVNEAVQAKYIGVRRLLQSREDLTITFQCDYSGITVEAGDVIRVNMTQYGWTNKLFRVANVTEEKYQDNSLGVRISAFEYNATIYADNAIEDFIPADNYAPEDPNVLSQPLAPTVAENPPVSGGTKSFKISAQTPSSGQIIYMDFNYGNNSNTQEHQTFRTIQSADGEVFDSSANVSIDESQFEAGTYYFSVTARNDLAGITSNSSNSFIWGGPGLYPYDPNSNTGGIGGNYIQPNSIGPNLLDPNISFIEVGNSLPGSGTIGDVFFLTGDALLYRWDGTQWTAAVPNIWIEGDILANQIANVWANTVFGNLDFANIANTAIIGNIVASQISNIYANSVFGNLTNANIANTAILGNIINSQISNVYANSVFGNLSNANIANTRILGNIINSQISNVYANSVFGNLSNANIANSRILGQIIDSQIANVFANSVYGTLTNALLDTADLVGTITETQISNNAITTPKIAAGAVYANKIAANTILANNIAAFTITGNQIAANSIFGNRILANSITTTQIQAGTITASDIAANTILGNNIAANTIAGDRILSNSVTTLQIQAGTITASDIAANTILGNNIAANTIAGDRILSNSITTLQIQAGTITASDIAAETILGNNIAANTIGGDRILANSITSTEIQAGTIQASDIAANTITGNQILANSVYGNRIIALSITAAEIAANAITANQLAANSVTTNQILAGAVTAAKIGVTQLDAITANMGTLNSGNILTDSNVANFRVEISSFGNLPIWYGNNTKDVANALFYVDNAGNAYFGGEILGSYRPVAWGAYNQTGDTTRIVLANYNCTIGNPGVGNTGTGKTRITFTSTRPSTNYIVVSNANENAGGGEATNPTGIACMPFAFTTSYFAILTRNLSGDRRNADYVGFIVFAPD